MPKKFDEQARIAINFAVRHAFKRDPKLFTWLVAKVNEAGQLAGMDPLLAETKLGPRLTTFKCPWCNRFGRHKECLAKMQRWNHGKKLLAQQSQCIIPIESAVKLEAKLAEEPKVKLMTPAEELGHAMKEIGNAALTSLKAKAPSTKINAAKNLKAKLDKALNQLNQLKKHGTEQT